MEYRDDLRQAILGGSGEEEPRRRWGRAKRDKAPAPKAPSVATLTGPEPETPSAPAEPKPRRSSGPAFKKRTGWALRTRQPETASGDASGNHPRSSLWSGYSLLGLLGSLAFAPVAAVTVALSLYIAGSPFSPDKALGHLVAMGGCEPAAVVGLAPASAGMPGYHTPLDPDGNGVSCTPEDLALAEGEMPGNAGAIQPSGAKTVRP